MTTTRTYGYLYNSNSTTKDDAASIRRTIKTLTKAGMLPADWTYSVRSERFAGGSAIRVNATAPRAIFACQPDAYDHPSVTHAQTGERVSAYVDRYTIEANLVRTTLEELHDAHNHDGSDTMTDYWDVKFYGTVGISVIDGVNKVMEIAR